MRVIIQEHQLQTSIAHQWMQHFDSNKFHISASPGTCLAECYGLANAHEFHCKQRNNTTTLVSLKLGLRGQMGGLFSLQETAARAAQLLPWQQRLGLEGHCFRRPKRAGLPRRLTRLRKWTRNIETLWISVNKLLRYIKALFLSGIPHPRGKAYC